MLNPFGNLSPPTFFLFPHFFVTQSGEMNYSLVDFGFMLSWRNTDEMKRLD